MCAGSGRRRVSSHRSRHGPVRAVRGSAHRRGDGFGNHRGDALRITYATRDGWELTEAQLWVGSRIGELPQTTSWNPTPGKFPHKAAFGGATTHTFSIPLSSPELNFSCPGDDSIYCVAAHAALRKRVGQTETGWSEGSRLTAKGNWATFSTVTLTCLCSVENAFPAGPSCNTAFAYDANANASFLDYGFSRWAGRTGRTPPAAMCSTSTRARARATSPRAT